MKQKANINNGEHRPPTSNAVYDNCVSKGVKSGVNLNDITDVGIYSVDFGGSSWTALNFPYENYGSLIVSKTQYDQISQIYIPDTTNIIFHRVRYSGNWGGWNPLNYAQSYSLSWDTNEVAEIGSYSVWKINRVVCVSMWVKLQNISGNGENIFWGFPPSVMGVEVFGLTTNYNHFCFYFDVNGYLHAYEHSASGGWMRLNFSYIAS